MTKPTAPSVFLDALESLESAPIRPELVVNDMLAPEGLAPWAAAFTADLKPTRFHEDSDLATGRLVLLYDEAEPDVWGGPFRIVSFASAPFDVTIGEETLLSDVAWSWLKDALSLHNAQYQGLAGTITRIISRGYGQLADQGDGSVLEIRCSWSPLETEIGKHFTAWTEMMCMFAGLPPKP